MHSELLKLLLGVAQWVTRARVVEVHTDFTGCHQFGRLNGSHNTLFVVRLNLHYSKLTSGASWASASASKYPRASNPPTAATSEVGMRLTDEL